MTNSDNSTPFRILVIAADAIDGPDLRSAVRSHGGERPAEVLVVAPALGSRLRFWTSDVDPARRRAAARLRHSLPGLRGDGFEVEGSIGDADPLQAIADGLRLFPAELIVLVTHDEEEQLSVERGLVERVRAQVGALPVVHLVAGARRLEVALAA